VIVSEELDELYQLADRLMVMSGGRLSQSKAPHELSVEDLGRWMAGFWPTENHRTENAEHAREFVGLVPRETPSRVDLVIAGRRDLLTLLAGSVLFAALGTSPLQD
jgi:ABC-type sugar transport system ATPase subunit